MFIIPKYDLNLFNAIVVNAEYGQNPELNKYLDDGKLYYQVDDTRYGDVTVLQFNNNDKYIINDNNYEKLGNM